MSTTRKDDGRAVEITSY
jgi:hypothetical protein